MKASLFIGSRPRSFLAAGGLCKSEADGLKACTTSTRELMPPGTASMFPVNWEL